MVIVSACLMGINCRYNGGNCLNEILVSILSKGIFIPVCPEQSGGLPTPRLPSQIVSGNGQDVLDGRASVFDSSSRNVTGQFIRGANEVMKIAKLMKIDTAIMKEYSPSCGVCHIKSSDISVKGMGVTSSLLSENGINVISSDMLNAEYVRYHYSR